VRSQIGKQSFKSQQTREKTMQTAENTFEYSKWRHGGWYVLNVRYPSGAVGCVSRNYPDRKWRIACDRRPDDHTYPNRDAAARAERDLIAAGVLS
jgi:hypothetical protein